MSHSVVFDFKRSPVYKKSEGGRNVYSAVASTAALDRDREILIPKGVNVDQFMKNPVMLHIHQHKQLPVGRVLSIAVEEDAVKFEFEFYDDETGSKVERMYQTGFMNAFSVGFIPKSYLPTWDLPDEVTTLDVELPDGSKRTIDFTKYEQRPWGIIPSWELLEISPVPVPSNPEALLQRAADTIIRKFAGSGCSKAVASMLEDTLSRKMAEISDSINSFVKAIDEEVSVTNVIPYAKMDVDESPFDLVDELAKLVRLCSSDGTGEKETIDWVKFAKAYGWFDTEKADAFTSYKYLHHSVKEGDLRLSKAGLFTAMASLLADSHKDQELVYQHLAQHYVDLDCVAPPLSLGDGNSYTPEQLSLVAEGKDPFEVSASESNKDDVTEVVVSDVMDKRLDQFEALLREFEAGLKVRMQIVIHMLEEVSEKMNALAKEPPVADDNAAPEELGVTENEICAQLSRLKSLFNFANVTA